MDDIVKATVYLTDADDYEKMNEVYMSFFNGPAPARTTVVVKLVLDKTLVEIEAVAYKPRA
jgi:2-iminobutanoate/2-iminopropanoate deaminase